MRKLTGLMVVLLAVGLLTVAGAPPATAQLADPLSLAASGVLLPFFSTTASGFISVLEVASPTVPFLSLINPGPILNPNNSIHMVFFSDACSQGQSFPDVLTPKQAKMYVSTVTPSWPQNNGLVAIAKSLPGSGTSLDPLDYPIWTRMHWLDTKTGRLRELEPITVDTFDHLVNSASVTGLAGQILTSVGSPATYPAAGFPPAVNSPTVVASTASPLVWNPMRTAASWMTIQEGANVAATVYVICPRATIQSATSTSAGIFARTKFPALNNHPSSSGAVVQGFPANNNIALTAPMSLNGRIYDTDEEGPFDFSLPCDCLTVQPLKTLHTKYSDPPKVIANKPYLVPSWYTEVEARSVNPNQSNDPSNFPPSQFFSFTGYWGLEITNFPSTLFHRFSNSSLDNIQPNLAAQPGLLGPSDPRANR